MDGTSFALSLNGEKIFGGNDLINEIGIYVLNWEGDTTANKTYYIQEVLFMKREYVSYEDLEKEDLL